MKADIKTNLAGDGQRYGYIFWAISNKGIKWDSCQNDTYMIYNKVALG